MPDQSPLSLWSRITKRLSEREAFRAWAIDANDGIATAGLLQVSPEPGRPIRYSSVCRDGGDDCARAAPSGRSWPLSERPNSGSSPTKRGSWLRTPMPSVTNSSTTGRRVVWSRRWRRRWPTNSTPTMRWAHTPGRGVRAGSGADRHSTVVVRRGDHGRLHDWSSRNGGDHLLRSRRDRNLGGGRGRGCLPGAYLPGIRKNRQAVVPANADPVLCGRPGHHGGQLLGRHRPALAETGLWAVAAA